jgi:hypothetical protein
VAKADDAPSPAEGGGQGDSQQTQVERQVEQPAAKPAKSSDALIGGLVWVVIFLVGGFIWLRGNVADVYLDVSPTDPRVLSGVVLYDGAPVSSGRTVIETWDSTHRRLIGSAVFEVGADGRFTTKAEDLPAEVGAKQVLRIDASYVGSVKTTDKEDAKPEEITGATTLHLNQSAPLDVSIVVIVGVALAALLGSLVWLFTLELTQGRARSLFRLTYVVILVALSVPILLIAIAARSEQVVNAMEQAPVGLVKGCSDAVKKPQWLVNIGGAVRSRALEAESPPEEPRTAAGDASASAAQTSADAITPYIEGGLVVPFFVLILALLGGAINMTMKVPTIQEQYQVATLPRSPPGNVLNALAKSPVALFSGGDGSVRLTEEQAKVVSGIRRTLIAQYMFLLSAPFLAIAVYYLLQVVAREVEEPVLVLMSFATGIVSDKIVNGISAFAEGVLQTLRRGRGADADTDTETAEDDASKVAPLPGGGT